MRFSALAPTCLAILVCLSTSQGARAGELPGGWLVAQVMPGDSGGLSEFPPVEASSKEKLKFANQVQEEIREGSALLQKWIDEARKSKDVVFLSCLNEKMSNLNALLRVAETASILMQEAINQSETERVDLLFRKVYICRQKARQLLQEAEECSYQAGEVLGTEGEGEAEIQEIQRPVKEYEEPLDPDESIDLGVDYYYCP